MVAGVGQSAVAVLFVLKARALTVVGKVVTWVTKQLTESFGPLPIVASLSGEALRWRLELVAENVMLRQQLIGSGELWFGAK